MDSICLTFRPLTRVNVLALTFNLYMFHCRILGIENEVCRIPNSFTKILKTIPLHYGLFEKILRSVLYLNYLI